MDSSFAGGLLALLLLTAFVKIFTTLTILRVGMGLREAGLGLVVFLLSISLSLLISAPQLSELGGSTELFSGRMLNQGAELEAKLMPFIERNTQPVFREKVFSLAGDLRKGEPKAPDSSAGTGKSLLLQSAFILSQLQQAVELGLLMLLPFLVIDLVVANAFMALGVTQLKYAVVSLPFKLLLFVAMDGWNLIADKLVHSYV